MKKTTLTFNKKNLSGTVVVNAITYLSRLDLVEEIQRVAEKEGNLKAAKHMHVFASKQIDSVDLQINGDKVENYDDIGLYAKGQDVYQEVNSLLQNGISSPN